MSLRNVYKGRIKKERSQPNSRKKLGLLEKKKDYIERARDFQKKKATLQKLKREVALKNPDEFYFKMKNTHLRDGIHEKDNNKKEKTEDELFNMRTQDIGYLSMRETMEKRKIESLQENHHFYNTKTSK